MSARVTKSMQTLIDRWTDHVFVPGVPSPFDRTETGAEDYRGARYGDREIYNAQIENIDFTGARFDNLRLTECAFTNCTFDRADLTFLYTASCRFEACRFRQTDLRAARIGYR